ncbi:MAG: hypothetical protein KF838_12060 [Phycisphaeraceae bacterium]|nr:MAG: hypothetical protein KF838_12060 [Phycisphaeraceae bacterium]
MAQNALAPGAPFGSVAFGDSKAFKGCAARGTCTRPCGDAFGVRLGSGNRRSLLRSVSIEGRWWNAVGDGASQHRVATGGDFDGTWGVLRLVMGRGATR